MKYLQNKNSKWVKTEFKCPRDEMPIYREMMENGRYSKNFCCERDGCTFTDHPGNIANLLLEIFNDIHRR